MCLRPRKHVCARGGGVLTCTQVTLPCTEGRYDPVCRAPASEPPDAGTEILAPMQEPSDFTISSSSLLYAMRIIKAAISWGHGRVNQVNTHKVLRECLPYSSNSGPRTYLSSVNGEPAKRVFSCSSGH